MSGTWVQALGSVIPFSLWMPPGFFTGMDILNHGDGLPRILKFGKNGIFRTPLVNFPSSEGTQKLMEPNERIRLIRTYHELWLLNYDTGHGRAVFSQESAAESNFFFFNSCRKTLQDPGPSQFMCIRRLDFVLFFSVISWICYLLSYCVSVAHRAIQWFPVHSLVQICLSV